MQNRYGAVALRAHTDYKPNFEIDKMFIDDTSIMEQFLNTTPLAKPY